MKASNAHIARVFFRMANLLELTGTSPFKVRAYRTAAERILELPYQLEKAFRNGDDLARIPGIGASIEGSIVAIIETGILKQLEQLKEQTPETLLELLSIRGLGPAKVRLLHQTLGVEDVEQLRQALETGRLESVEGLSCETVDRVRRSLYEYLNHRGRTLRFLAEQTAHQVVDFVEHCPAAELVMLAGSFRRGKETVGTIDAVVATRDPGAVADHVREWSELARVVSSDAMRFSFEMHGGIRVVLLFALPPRFGAAVHYHTGSAAYNFRIGKLAAEKQLRAEPFGLVAADHFVDTPDERAFYAALGLPFIPPELREDRGELEAAQSGTLPALVEYADVRGDLHVHTTFTDGKDSIREIVLAARHLGYEYVAITDHTRNVAVANGLKPARVEEYLQEIERVNESVGGITVLKGLEVDILVDGRMDLPV